MPGALTHAPADIVSRVLIAESLGADPTTSNPTWPVFVSNEPNNPDRVITIYDTAGTVQASTHPDSEIQEQHGIQIRIRAQGYGVGYTKARAIAVAIDQDVYQYVVTIAGTSYNVHSIDRVTDVIPLGKQVPETKRDLFTINALVTVIAL